jgi:hypothetical protein
VTGTRRIGLALALAAIFGGGLAYGVAMERTRIFPYDALVTAYRSARSVVSPAPPLRRGRWRQRQATGSQRDLTEEQLAEIERLEAMAYLSGSRPAPAHSGVTVHDSARAWTGLNLVVSGHAAWAGLMDMDGSVLHEWHYEFRDVWPDDPISDEIDWTHYWRRVHLYGNGDILALFERVGLIKLDSGSNLLWDRPHGYHHDLFVDADGAIYILQQKAHVVPRWDPEQPLLEHFITVLDTDGDIRKAVSLLTAFENSPYSPTLNWAPPGGDAFHSNSIEVLDGRLADRSPAFRDGNVLTSLRELDTIAVVDLDAETIAWALSGQWHRQHEATILPNGRMLLFDNLHAPGVSEVLEIDPFSQVVHWSYAGSDEAPFYSETCGANQRLPNGNTLIVESDNGRAFEVTADETIVWEYVNPHRAGEESELIAALLDVVRLPEDFPTDWIHHQK